MPSADRMNQGGRAAVPTEVMGPRLLLTVVTFVLVVIGSVMVFSASSIMAIEEGADPLADALRQFGFVAIGAVMCFGIAKVLPYRVWKGWFTWAVFALSVLLLVLTAAIGTEDLGAQRWLTLGPINLQPSEFAKIGVLLVMVKLIYDYQEGALPFPWFMGGFIALNLVIVLLIFVAQSDLGTTAICLIGIIAILWLSEVRAQFVVGYAGIVTAVGCLGLTAGYRWERLMSFMDPWEDPYDSGYQLIHSYYAFAQGGVLGQGLGGSAQKYLYLPEAQTDFIFSIIGEEMGLLGSVLVIALFLAFLYGGLRMAQAAPDRFGSMLCGSFSVIIVFQAFLNIGCVMGVLPITGKPLPFVSAGGSSLIASLIMVGIMLSVSHGSDEPTEYRRRRQDLRLVDQGGASSRRAAPRPAPGRYATYGTPGFSRPVAGGSRAGGPGYSRGLPAAGHGGSSIALAGSAYRSRKGRR